jgi:hypothetical protein
MTAFVGASAAVILPLLALRLRRPAPKPRAAT